MIDTSDGSALAEADWDPAGEPVERPGNPVEQLLVMEFTELRRGWALGSDALADRIGPGLARLVALSPEVANQELRRRLLALVERLLRNAAEEDRLAVRAALGIEHGIRLPHLTERTLELSRRLHCSERGARRKIARAFILLAQAGAVELDGIDDATRNADEGWYVRRFEASLRLDLGRPELTEQRTVVARWDGISHISARLSVPRRHGAPLRLEDVEVETRFGARIVSREQQSESHFKFLLALPAPLARGEAHEYEIVFRLPRDWPVQPHYAFVPLVPCESFRLRVRFDPERPPAALWSFDRLAHRALEGKMTPGKPLSLDAHGEAVLRFDRLEQGFAYGIEWLPQRANPDPLASDSPA